VRVHPDTYPTRLQSFIAQTPSGVPEWHDWDDAHIPRTARPAELVAHPCRPQYPRAVSGLSSHIIYR
jgi:hypothetical protein